MANDHAIAPPQSCPTIAASRSPKALTSPATSATSSGMAYAAMEAGFSLSLYPRRSGATTRKRVASAEIWWRHEYQDSGNPCSSTTSGPSPLTTQWRRTPLVRTSLCSSGIRARLGRRSFSVKRRRPAL